MALQFLKWSYKSDMFRLTTDKNLKDDQIKENKHYIPCPGY